MGVAERKQREKEQKRNAILDCAEKLFISKGFKDTSVDDIAHCAEYSKGTMYLYFKSKDEIFMNIFHRALNLMYTEFRNSIKNYKTGKDQIYAIGDAHFKFLNKYPDYYSIMKFFDSFDFDFTNLEDIMSQIGTTSNLIDNLMIDAIRLGQKDGTIRSDMDAEMICILLQTMSRGVFGQIETHKKYHLKFPNEYNEGHIFNGFFELVSTGISI